MTALPSFNSVRLEMVEPRIAQLTLNRPEKRNAFDTAMRDEIGAALAHVRSSRDIAVLIVTGAGNTFCAGGDISQMATGVPSEEAGRQRLMDMLPTVMAMFTLEIPVIAAVDGFAHGAGFNMALAADFLFATPQARFCQAFGRIGLVPDFGGSYILPRLVGLAKAKELIFTAREIDAEEARALGLVYRIVARDELMGSVREMAARLAQASPVAIAQSKRLLHASFQQDLRAILEAEAAAQGVCLVSDYHKRAVQDFLERRALERAGAPKPT
jgi:2-(1,2-epoxy-1,2-dihydrophenyl)acetyl-CoA isomerase